MSSSVTHVRRLNKDSASGYGLLVASMDGSVRMLCRYTSPHALNSLLPLRPYSSLGVYDTRFVPEPSSTRRQRPVLKLEGHCNQFTLNLGLDVWNEDFVAAGKKRKSDQD